MPSAWPRWSPPRTAGRLLAALVAKGVTATCTRPPGPRYGALDVDSNLPDVRIVLGHNEFATEVLAAAPAGYRAALAATGRVFVPAARTRATAVGTGRRPARARETCRC